MKQIQNSWETWIMRDILKWYFIFRKVIRVVVDQIYDDGCLGIRGLDVQVTQKLPNFQLLHAFPKALTHFPSELVTCKLQSNHSIKKDDIGANFKLKFLEMKKKYPLIELTRQSCNEDFGDVLFRDFIIGGVPVSTVHYTRSGTYMNCLLQ